MTLPESITDNGPADRNFRALDISVGAIRLTAPFETLKVIRGVFTTTTPTIVVGSGFTIARNGIGDVTVTFTTAFSAAPAIHASSDAGVYVQTYAAATTRLNHITLAGAASEGTVHFLAIGP